MQITVIQVLLYFNNLLINKNQKYKQKQFMNFNLINSVDSEYHKIMMQKHLSLKRQKKHNRQPSTQVQQTSKMSRMNTVQSLPLAGQTLVNNSWLNTNNNNNSGLLMNTRKKQVNEQNQKMKKLVKDQLYQSLTQQQNKMKQQNEYMKKLKKSMSTQNGMLDYLQKQIQKRDCFIKSCLINQQIRKNTFIDEDLRKHKTALQLIQQNYDIDVFNHQSDRYQQKQKINFQKVIQTNYIQAYQNKIQKQIQRNQYGRYLDQKYVKQRHNPITNPMEYHIENPYIKKKLVKY